MINGITGWINKNDYHLWIIFFICTMMASIFIQFIVLPYLFPKLHWGVGLVHGNDSLTFHSKAQFLAQRIVSDGWKNWDLKPWGQGNIGISTIFYTLFTPKPWVMIPVNAFLHATATIILKKILDCIYLINPKLTLWAVLPFFLFPSAATWYAQLHKDGYFILGNLLFIYGWILWMKVGKEEDILIDKKMIFDTLIIFAGFGLVWLIRPYWGVVLITVSIVTFFVFCGALLLSILRKRRRWGDFVFFVILTSGILTGLYICSSKVYMSSTIVHETPGRPEVQISLKDIPDWTPSRYLPHFIDDRLRSLAMVRNGFITFYLMAGTNIDTDVSFSSWKDEFNYLPRAIYIGFIMPNFQYWLSQGWEIPGTVMRRVSAIEMIFLYLIYPFAIWGIWTWKNRIEIWIFLIWAITGILMYTFVTPNIGTLYRFRYGFIMSFAALGIIELSKLITKIRHKKAIR
jgi:hypothetical protein